MKFHHVALTVKNVNRSSKWYVDKLGFRIINNYKNNGLEITLLQLADIRIELISFENKTNALPEYRTDVMQDIHTVGTKHLCIEVKNLDETIKELITKDVQFVSEIDTAAFGGRYIFLKDCDNILIELYQAKSKL